MRPTEAQPCCANDLIYIKHGLRGPVLGRMREELPGIGDGGANGSVKTGGPLSRFAARPNQPLRALKLHDEAERG